MVLSAAVADSSICFVMSLFSQSIEFSFSENAEINKLMIIEASRMSMAMMKIRNTFTLLEKLEYSRFSQ